MNSFTLWLIDIYHSFFLVLLLGGVLSILFGLFIWVDDFREGIKIKGNPCKISIIALTIGVFAILVCLFSPTKRTFIYMIGVTAEEIQQVYEPLGCPRYQLHRR